VELCIEDVRKVYGAGAGSTAALRGVSLTVDEPCAVAVMGASGSGKSTLLHLLGGLDRVTSGSILVRGSDVAGLRGRALVAHRRRVGFVFQSFHLVPGLTALENVELPMLPYEGRREIRRRALSLLERVALADRASALPGQLSGGQQQRVAIARALVSDPVLLLADEPTGNLDSTNAESVMDLLTHVRETTGATMVVATHAPEVAARCDQVVHLRDGRLATGRTVEPA